MAFYGTQAIQLDDKNRLRIPARFRPDLGKFYYVMYGTGGCLWVMSKEGFEEFTDKYDQIPESDLEAQNNLRRIMASVTVPEEDAQGRFVLPQAAKEFCGINKRVMFVGVKKRLEIWSGDNYNGRFLVDSTGFDKAFVGLEHYEGKKIAD